MEFSRVPASGKKLRSTEVEAPVAPPNKRSVKSPWLGWEASFMMCLAFLTRMEEFSFCYFVSHSSHRGTRIVADTLTIKP